MIVCLKYNRDWINEENKEKYWHKELQTDVPKFCKELKKKMCVEYHGAMVAEWWKSEARSNTTFPL